MSNTEALRAACAAMLAALDGMADRDDAGGLMPWAGYLGPYDGKDYGAALDAAMADARAALAQPAASGEPAIHWPQVIAYPGGNGGLGAWVDVSTGDGPECVTRYFAAQPAPALVPPIPDNVRAALCQMLDHYGNDPRATLVAFWLHSLPAAPYAPQSHPQR